MNESLKVKIKLIRIKSVNKFLWFLSGETALLLKIRF